MHTSLQGPAGGRRSTERRALQAFIAVAGLLPVFAGIAGVVAGPGLAGSTPPWPADLDSHFRFLSGVFLVVGLGWWSCIPAIETKGARLRLLALMTAVGGLARLYSVSLVGFPSAGHGLGLAMELVAVPLVVLWQARIARRGWRGNS
ncbi:DUF4345 domain-containing protein [Aquibium carbonis]|uniref:DUF4345 domain-containing protein n=2 Tax=Aquibium carbonis TaxID=2495581 RepID=A0A429Z1D0_9HYPH|nr:DUF4345 domain-containing protein [Aquibium carbonis]